METPIRTNVLAGADAQSAVSWASIAAGAVVAAALSLALFALGAGLGLSSISPWADSGVSASTFKNATGIYLVLVAVMSSAIGGYLAARLRTKWAGVNTNEVFFRDTAHGLVTWAFATVLSASALGAAATHVVVGRRQGQARRRDRPCRTWILRASSSTGYSEPTWQHRRRPLRAPMMRAQKRRGSGPPASTQAESLRRRTEPTSLV
jgi:hypothetical protein